MVFIEEVVEGRAELGGGQGLVRKRQEEHTCTYMVKQVTWMLCR